jgi:hypothetical protein
MRFAAKLTPQGPENAVPLAAHCHQPRCGRRCRASGASEMTLDVPHSIRAMSGSGLSAHLERRVAVVAAADGDEIPPRANRTPSCARFTVCAASYMQPPEHQRSAEIMAIEYGFDSVVSPCGRTNPSLGNATSA